jgi:hypothetical protein
MQLSTGVSGRTRIGHVADAIEGHAVPVGVQGKEWAVR